MAKNKPKALKTNYGLQLSQIEMVNIHDLKTNELNHKNFGMEGSIYFNSLKKDIKQKGIIVPLLAKTDGTLLCGHNRRIVALTLISEGEETFNLLPVQWVLSKLTQDEEEKIIISDNLHRRHLTSKQRTHFYKKLYPGFEERALIDNRGKNPFNSEEESVGLTIQKIVDDTGLSYSTVKKDLSNFRRQRSLQRKRSLINQNEYDVHLVRNIKNNITRIRINLEDANNITKKEVIKLLREAASRISVSLDGSSKVIGNNIKSSSKKAKVLAKS